MSNYQLQAEVNRLQSQLNQIERENNQLRSEIMYAVNSVNQAERELSNYNEHIRNSLDNATGVINHSINTSLSAYELQGQIDQLYTRYKQVELANKKIRSLNNKKFYDFNTYRTVRKIVQGMMDNLDLRMVSDAIIYKSIERQHLMTPDFWLTCALVSIMAWRNDDKELADRALENAVNLDRKNSSIFYMIFNMRMGRDEAAVKWFLEYQKCDLKGSDENTFLMLFSLISKTLSDTVDEKAHRLISEYIHRLIVAETEKAGYREEQVVGVICQKMKNFMQTEAYDLPVLATYCKDYQTIVKMLNLAGNNYNILEFIRKVVYVPVAEKNTYLKEYLKELLEKPNTVELETYREIEYNETIIRMGGDVKAAREAFEQEMKRRESEMSIISSMIGWIFDMGNEDINGQMRLNMFTLMKIFQKKAADSYFNIYRSLYQDIHPVEILDYAANVNFSDETGEAGRIEDFYQERQGQELSEVKNTAAYIAFGLGAACGAASFFTSLLLLTGLGIGACVGGGILAANHFKKKNIVLRIQKQKANVTDILHKLFDDYGKVKETYRKFDSVSEEIKMELTKL